MNKKNKSQKPLELYNDEQFKLIEEHIEKNFGEVNNYFQEKNPENIHVKIYTVPPTKEKPYYTLITVGMGAYLMNVPEYLDKEKLKRAELVICLPMNWRVNDNEPKYRWPLQLLSMLSRLPIEENAWLGCGHTVDYGESFAEESGFNGIILTNPTAGINSCICKFSDDEEVNFYQVILLHQNELDFKNKNGSSALINLFKKDFSPVYNPDRKSVVPENFMEILDTVEKHSCKVEEKELDILDINGANHIAAFLRWSIEHNLINDEMLEYFAEDIEQIQSGEYDIRKFLINSLGGELTTDLFNDKGKAFCKYYYDHYHNEDEPCYPADVDRMALDYFGEEKYDCEEFANEAYLFVPFDDDYYKAISKYIDKNY
ncbi:MAG: suppressor of fused domain protein, partial [Ruminococcus sp.]|nr:suppressor of fused domain protein [Ruminococcus sp.]